MRVSALEAFGLDEQVIEVWKNNRHEELLPIQEIAIRDGKILEGQHAVIFSPTSSGKTFVGEMAAIRVARQNRRVIYLVPQKALAEEKFADFKNKYASLGIRVVISTRERKEFDRDIRRGRFHIAVVVFEKMQGLMLRRQSMLRKVGLIVIDELQMIGDRARGSGLEVLLTKIKMTATRAQLIGLSAVLGSCQQLATWLGARLCTLDRRPIELRKGVLFNGQFKYVEHNGGATGAEQFGPPDEDTKGIFGLLVAHVRQLAERREQCLVFCKSKQDCVKVAKAIARHLRVARSSQALQDLHLLEDSNGKDVLGLLLDHGVAYHNADLDWDQRDVVERGFRKGDIRVVCATSTLAMGLNLPARNVFIDPERWELDRWGRWGTVAISQAEYENISGRAGRLGLEKQFGRAIIVTDSAFDAETFFKTFAQGRLGEVEPALADESLAQHVLNLVASEICKTGNETRDLLLSSYTGSQLWRGGARQEIFEEQFKIGLLKCVGGGLIANRGGKLIATDLGRLAAVKGISVDTAIQLDEFAKRYKSVAEDMSVLEVLLCLTLTEDGDSTHFNLSTHEYDAGTYLEHLKAKISALPPGPRCRLNPILKMTLLSYERTKRAKKTLILHDWANGIATREIERRYHCLSGSASSLGTEFSWLADAFASVAAINEWPQTETLRMQSISEQLAHGVPAAALEIAKARVRGMGRGRIVALLGKDFSSLEKIVAATQLELERWIPASLAEAFQLRARSILERRRIENEGENSSGESTNPATDEASADEWTDQFSPSDEMGMAYRSDVAIHLDGLRKQRRHLVKINGKECWLTGQSFDALLCLAKAAKTTALGWLSCDQIGTHETYHQVIRRLKQDLKVDGVDLENLIENNGIKQYRLSTPPQQITLPVKEARS